MLSFKDMPPRLCLSFLFFWFADRSFCFVCLANLVEPFCSNLHRYNAKHAIVPHAQTQ
ncbi:hypothetical protein ACSS6W_003932 [Trichoderma asperelloides]